MNPETILALTPGKQLDEAVHEFVFGNAGPCENYSTNDAAGAKIMDRLTLFVGRVDGGPRFSPQRPWIAGILAWEGSIGGYATKLSVTAPTRLVSLCKAALLLILQPAKPTKAAPSSAQQAREVAARIGTPGARSPAAGILAAEKAAAKKQADRAAKQEKEARKAAKRTGRAYVAPDAPETVVQRQPRLAQPGVRPQPSVFTGERAPRAPMPTRPKEIVLPQPIDTGGNDRRAAT